MAEQQQQKRYLSTYVKQKEVFVSDPTLALSFFVT